MAIAYCYMPEELTEKIVELLRNAVKAEPDLRLAESPAGEINIIGKSGQAGRPTLVRLTVETKGPVW